MDDAENADLVYSIRLLIKHPQIDPALITARLGLTPHLSWAVGKDRKTPIGTPLPGVYRETVWGYAYDVEGKRFFLRDVAAFVSRLQEKAAFLRELTDTGGSVGIHVHLPGDVNIGSVIHWQDLEKMAALRIDLGVEVFPNFAPIHRI